MSKELNEVDKQSLNKLLKIGDEEKLINSCRRHMEIEKVKDIKLKRMCADLTEAVCYSLVCLRRSGFLLTLETYNQSLEISNIVSFCTDPNLSIECRFKLKKYLRQLPGYDNTNDFSELLSKGPRRSYDKIEPAILYHEKVVKLVMFNIPEEESREDIPL